MRWLCYSSVLGGNVKIFVLLYCHSYENLPGNLLFFESVRIGFPDAEIHVVDNDCAHVYREQFESKTEKINGIFSTFKREVLHSNFIESLVKEESEDFYIIDPDTVWFRRMPENYDAPIAGRLIPAFFDSYTGCNTFSRLHTSCLFLSPARIRNQIAMLNKFAFNGFHDDMIKQDGSWFRYDTCGKLFHALREKAHIFNDQENSAFAHLFCGTHLSLIKQYYPQLAEIHKSVYAGERDLQWLYREQDNFFRSLGFSA